MISDTCHSEMRSVKVTRPTRCAQYVLKKSAASTGTSVMCVFLYGSPTYSIIQEQSSMLFLSPFGVSSSMRSLFIFKM